MKKFVTTLGQTQINLAGILLIVLISTIWSWQGSFFASSRDVELDIPRGAAELIANGGGDSIIPDVIRLQQGDRIVLVNDDVVGHRVGGIYASAGSTVTAKFNAVGSFSYLCSVHPSGQTVFDVAEGPKVMPLVWTIVTAIGLLGLVNGLFVGGFTSWESAGMVVIGAAVVIAAIGVLGSMAVTLFGKEKLSGSEALSGSNPVAPSSSSIASGKSTYLQFCSTCHGDSTRGNGPLAVELDPPPADLIIHVPLHPDNVLFQFVQEGIPGSSMPPLGAAISDKETWHLVNYLRTLE